MVLAPQIAVAADNQRTIVTATQLPSAHTTTAAKPTPMTKIDAKPTLTTQQEVRQARLAAELRANLKKRKALAREKSADTEPESHS
jgi:hypothetical protein